MTAALDSRKLAEAARQLAGGVDEVVKMLNEWERFRGERPDHSVRATAAIGGAAWALGAIGVPLVRSAAGRWAVAGGERKPWDWPDGTPEELDDNEARRAALAREGERIGQGLEKKWMERKSSAEAEGGAKEVGGC